MVPNFLVFMTSAKSTHDSAYSSIFAANTGSHAHFGRHLGIHHANVSTVALNDIKGIGRTVDVALVRLKP